MRDWDVIVIGAGPAGSSAAISCARRGLQVLMVDAKRFPRHKVCGGCLNQVSTAILRDLIGAEHPLWASALPVRSFRLTHAGREFSFSTPEGFAVARAELDNSLVATAMELGVSFRAPVGAKLAAVEGGFRQVRLKEPGSEEVARAKMVVVASGLDNRQVTSESDLQHRAHPDSRVGVEAIFSDVPEAFGPETIHMVVGRQGYVGLTQISGGRLHVAAAVDRTALQGSGPRQLIEGILTEAGAGGLPADDSVAWRGTLPLTSRAKRLGAERVLLVGDAAGYVEPFTGEGIRWALQGGSALGPFAERACQQWQAALVDDWEAWYAARILKDQRLCRLLSWGLKRPSARWLAHTVLRTSPRVASGIINRINHKAQL